jgi:hypothetical protein
VPALVSVTPPGELHLERHGPAPCAFVFAVQPNLVDKRLQFGYHRLEFSQVSGECILGADRLPDPVRPDLPVVDASRDPIVVRAGLTEVGSHELQSLISHVEAGVQAERVHFRASCRPDPVEFTDGQAFDERRPHRGRDDELAVRLAVVGGELREELVIGNAGRGVEACSSGMFRRFSVTSKQCCSDKGRTSSGAASDGERIASGNRAARDCDHR